MFKNMKIGTRLGLAFTTMVSITLVICTLATMRMGQMDENTDAIVNDRYPKTVAANDLIDNVNLISRAARNALLFTDNTMIETEIARIRDTQKKNGDLIEKLEAGVKSDKGKEQLGKIKESRQKFAAGTDKLIELAQSDAAAATDYLIKEFSPVNNAYLGAVNDLIKYQGELMEESGKESKETYAASRNFMIALSAISALLSAALGIWIVRSITRPINQAVVVANQLAEGDLTVKIEVNSRDETGQLLASMQNMVEKLSQ
ncbi:MAG: MCP four helix bundle domain-containing protein, partial [Thiobacillus sp.]